MASFGYNAMTTKQVCQSLYKGAHSITALEQLCYWDNFQSVNISLTLLWGTKKRSSSMWNAIINRNHGVGGVGSSQEANNQEHNIIGNSSSGVGHRGGICHFFVWSLQKVTSIPSSGQSLISETSNFSWIWQLFNQSAGQR